MQAVVCTETATSAALSVAKTFSRFSALSAETSSGKEQQGFHFFPDHNIGLHFSNFPANPPVLGTNLCFFGVTNSNTSEREAPGNEQKLTACTQQDRDHLVIQRWISPAGTLPVAHPTVVLPSETPTALKPFQLLPVWSRLTCGSAHTPLCTPSAQSSHWHWGHTYPCGPWSYSRGWHWFLVTLVPPVAGTKAQGQS